MSKRMAWPWLGLFLLSLFLMLSGIYFGWRDGDWSSAVRWILTYINLVALFGVGTLEVWLKKIRGYGITGKR